MNYKEWEIEVPVTFKEDSLWKVAAYRYALFLSDLCWHDMAIRSKNRTLLSTADRLYRAVNSVGANIAEGYSRSTGKDRALFYQYALSSARESRDWYYKARHVLSENELTQRFNVLTEIIKLLLTRVPQQHGRVLREDQATYDA